MPESLQIITLGCSKNTVDTEHLLSSLKERYELVPEGEDRYVDYLLVNTCGFIGDAKEQSIQTILHSAAGKEDGRVGKLVVFGCLSQRYAKEMPELIPEVDKWFGARDLRPLLSYLGVEQKEEYTTGRVLTGNRKGTAFLKISEGCDRRCSYCAIPYIRGAHKSVPVETLVEEAVRLASDGVKELVIIAQDTTYYGLDLYHERALSRLLQALSEVEGIEWIRIHYSYPTDFPDDVLDLMATNPKICKYMDIPLQHISDKVLDAMHRHITSAQTHELIARMRAKVPGVVLRTTMIVGHPGEGEEEFEQLLDFVRDARFERLGAFTYSEEEGTYGAAHLKDDVPEEEKDRRLDAIMSLQSEISLEWNKSRVGSVVKVLVEDCVDGTLVCRSECESPEVDGEILVQCPGDVDPDEICGTFIDVQIIGADEYDLIATIAHEN